MDSFQGFLWRENKNVHPSCSQVTDDLEDIGIFLLDGSEIDEEYFATLEPQTTLIFRRPGEEILTGNFFFILFLLCSNAKSILF